jgi:hypothetical protein
MNLGVLQACVRAWRTHYYDRYVLKRPGLVRLYCVVRVLKSMQSLQPLSGLRTKCTWLYSDAWDFSITPRDSNSAIYFLRSTSLSLVKNRGASRFLLLVHFGLSIHFGFFSALFYDGPIPALVGASQVPPSTHLPLALSIYACLTVSSPLPQMAWFPRSLAQQVSSRHG